MLVCRSSSRWALNVPLLLLAMSAAVVFGGVVSVLEGLSWRSAGMMLFALLVVGLSLNALRLIRLAELLFAERPTREDAPAAQEVVNEREAKYLAGDVLLYVLGMGAYFLTTQLTTQ